MNKLLIIISALLLSSCMLMAPKFPEAPIVLTERCPPLKLIPTDHTEFSELLKITTQNYTTYFECSVKVDAWVEWYNTQKKIYEKGSK